MVNRIYTAIFLLGIALAMPLVAQSQATQNLTAFVDSTEVTLNDIFTLTIRVDSSLGSARPSLAGLNRDFEQIGNISTRSSYSNINGTVQSFVDYIVRLRPLSTGTLTIPAFRVGGEVTSPIRVTVGEGEQLSGTGNDEIFIISGVSKDSIYVQEQLLYTIKLYYSISFDQGAQLTSPQVANAVVQQLGSDETYSEIVDGIRYNVTERNFVIFPQSSGELTIPPVYFTATVGRRGGLTRFFNNRTSVREINLASDTHLVDVMSKPASFPGQTWLPASEVTVEESWSGPVGNMSIGDSVTRNIKINASGLSSSLLPGVEYDDIPGLKFYPDQPLREDAANDQGVTGSRAEGTAIVPSEAGDFVIPEVVIPWWNTTTDTLEEAIIPARTLSVLPGNPSNQPAMTGFNLPSNDPGSAMGSESPAASSAATSGLALFWISSTAVFAVAWLFSTMMWLRNRRMLAFVATATPAMMPHQQDITGRATPDADTALKVLKRACHHNNLTDIKRCLITWGQALYEDKSLLTLEQLRGCCQNEKLNARLTELERLLYSDNRNDVEYNGEELYSLIASIHKKGGAKHKSSKKDYSLPPLYKN